MTSTITIYCLLTNQVTIIEPDQEIWRSTAYIFAQIISILAVIMIVYCSSGDAQILLRFTVKKIFGRILIFLVVNKQKKIFFTNFKEPKKRFHIKSALFMLRDLNLLKLSNLLLPEWFITSILKNTCFFPNFCVLEAISPNCLPIGTAIHVTLL